MEHETGGPAILDPSGCHPWLLGGSEDPWLSVPAFWRVWRCCFLSVVDYWLLGNLIAMILSARERQFRSVIIHPLTTSRWVTPNRQHRNQPPKFQLKPNKTICSSGAVQAFVTIYEEYGYMSPNFDCTPVTVFHAIEGFSGLRIRSL